MNDEAVLRVDFDQLDALAGAPGELTGEMMAEVRDMWAGLKEDLVVNWVAEAGGDAAVLRRALHRQRGLVASWGLEGVAAGMMAAERAEDPVGAWRESGPRLRAELPRIFAAVEARHPGLA